MIMMVILLKNQSVSIKNIPSVYIILFLFLNGVILLQIIVNNHMVKANPAVNKVYRRIIL
ncbi:hypothetical protein BBH99_16165 [Chryseobacterium contaminans]|uniref:Uncharacterized protein n=1 Tax=Chryseobacterium contaminans TaxID=1423959 RepID=A0ABX2XA21_9FLAO|nr:hypothetical protein BBH99_16165 [Chryseobacterium contaminans]